MAARSKTPVLVLSGAPRAVRGRITVANTGGERLVIRGGTLHLPEREPLDVQFTAIVQPGATVDEIVSVDLGTATPAGISRGELEVGGQRRAVEVRVAQTIALEISPSDALVAAGRTPLTIVARNLGNVTVPLAHITRGRLVAHDSGDPHTPEGPEAVLRLPRTMSLLPGEEVTLQAEVEIPQGLAADRRHRAILPIGTAGLTAIVLPYDPTPAPTKPRKRPITSTKRSTTTKES